MDSRKYMMRMVRRGLLRSPIKSIRYLKQTMKHVREGPMGKRPKR